MDKQNQSADLNNSEEISLKEVILKIRECWLFLLSKWIIILIAGIIGGTIGLAYAWVKKPLYKAELSFVVQDEKSSGGIGGALGLASQFGIDLGGGGVGGEFTGDNLLELMKSRSMIEKTLLTVVDINGKKETLAEFYIDFNELRKSWKEQPLYANIHFLPGANRANFTLEQNSLLGDFRGAIIKNNLIVDKLDKKLSIISITVKSPNELFSKYFTETLAKVVSDFYIQTKTEKAAKNVAMLQKQSDSVKSTLNEAISGVAISTDVNPNANPLLQVLHVPSQRKQIDVQANSATFVQLKTNLEIAKMSLLQETPLIQIIDRPIFPLEKERVGKFKGLIIGGFIGALLAMILFLIKKVFKEIMS
ncbi:MAG: lipopolysaccharide biosynthesis protein [Bacteroidota bacterium]